MRDNSNTFMYIVAGIIFLHFLVGFVWLVLKLYKKNEDKKGQWVLLLQLKLFPYIVQLYSNKFALFGILNTSFDRSNKFWIVIAGVFGFGFVVFKLDFQCFQKIFYHFCSSLFFGWTIIVSIIVLFITNIKNNIFRILIFKYPIFAAVLRLLFCFSKPH